MTISKSPHASRIDGCSTPAARDMANHHDRLGRRSRLSPSSTGKRVSPRDRDLVWFEKLHEHGPLPTSFLLAFTRDMRRSEKRARERLTDLFNEDDTPDGGPYLLRPPQQFRTLDSRYNQLVYELAPAGERALDRLHPSSAVHVGANGPWLHGFMTSCITASFELATMARSDIAYIPQSAILTRANATLRHPVSVADPRTGREIRMDLAPDAIFGLEYRTPSGSKFRFFAVEADRATEPVATSAWNRKSFMRSLLHYENYVGGEIYRDHLQLTAPLLVLIVCSDPMRTARMIEAAAGRYSHGNSFMLFQTWEDFGPVFRPAPPRTEVLDGEWLRAGFSSLHIGRV